MGADLIGLRSATALPVDRSDGAVRLAVDRRWVSMQPEPNEVEFSSRWILGDFCGAAVDGAFFLMDFSRAGSRFRIRNEAPSETIEQFLIKSRAGVAAMVSTAQESGHEYILDRCGFRGHHGKLGHLSPVNP